MSSPIWRVCRAAPWHSAAVLAALAALCGACGSKAIEPPEDRDWRVFAIEYGTSSQNRSMLVQGAPKSERAAMSWYAWLLVSKRSVNRRVLVDTGFDDAERAKKWRFTRRERVNAILERAGVAPASITDVVLTHSHWDHAGDTAPYVNARRWVRKGFPGASEEIANGVSLIAGGGHTKDIQWVRIALGDERRRTVAIASDVAYLYENLETLTPTGSTTDSDADLAAMRAMLSATGSAALILPGHDPEVAKRLSRVAENAYELK